MGQGQGPTLLGVDVIYVATMLAAVAAFAERHGRPPARLEQLVAAGLLPAIPADPYGGRYVVGDAGDVRSTGGGWRLRPAEPAHRYGVTQPEPARGAAPTWSPRLVRP